jgi:hypothetical protein
VSGATVARPERDFQATLGQIRALLGASDTIPLGLKATGRDAAMGSPLPLMTDVGGFFCASGGLASMVLLP